MTLLTIIGCSPKSTPESEALLQEINEVRSRTKVGINYVDYSRAAQELQIKLDNFERSKKSIKIKYARNLVETADRYIDAADREFGGDWEPQHRWNYAEYVYDYLVNCQTQNKNCYGYDESLQMYIDLDKDSQERFDRLSKEVDKVLKELNK